MLLSRNGYAQKEDTCTLLAAAGFQALDMNDTCDAVLFSQPQAESVAYLRAALDTAHGAGLRVEQCHAPMTPCYKHLSTGAWETEKKSVETCLQVVGKLGIPYTVVHPLVYDWNDTDPDGFARNVAYLRRLCEVAEGTAVCIENMPGTCGVLRTGEDMYRLLEAVDDDRLMVCLDTGHLFYQKQKTSDFFARVGDRVRVTHIHDTVSGNDAHLPIGMGEGDWADFKAAIRDYGYTGNLNSESTFFSKTPPHLRLQGQILERQLLETLRYA